jgi:hypothetical protein
MPSRASAFAMWVAVAALSACSDPVHTHQVDALGGEQPGVPEGPLHRPGQPCNVCHGEYGPADSEFAFAGTVYVDSVGKVPLPDARVTLIDAKGKTYETGANCVGNFFIMKTDYQPTWPVWTTIFYGMMGGQPIPKEMSSPIQREGSCATCHADPPSVEAVGHVYLSEDQIVLPPSPSCP